MDALTPGPALAFPWLSNGGQNCGHIPLQALLSLRSFLKRYKVCPFEFTSTGPSLVVRRERVALVPVALLAIEPTARNPAVPTAAATPSTANLRIGATPHLPAFRSLPSKLVVGCNGHLLTCFYVASTRVGFDRKTADALACARRGGDRPGRRQPASNLG